MYVHRKTMLQKETLVLLNIFFHQLTSHSENFPWAPPLSLFYYIKKNLKNGEKRKLYMKY